MGIVLKEAQIQRALVKHLRIRIRDDVEWCHIPNGGRRDLIEAVNMKRMGVQPGWPDIIYLQPSYEHPGLWSFFGQEIKASGGRLSEAQLCWHSRAAELGAYCGISEGLEATLKMPETWGLLK